MIRGSGTETVSTYSQTLNRQDPHGDLIALVVLMEVLSGPILVSRTGDAG